MKEVKMYPLQERVLRSEIDIKEREKILDEMFNKGNPKYILVPSLKEKLNKEAYFDLLPTTLDGVGGYIIDDWKNVLKPKELPDRYRVEDGAYFAEYNDGKGVVLFDILNTTRFIHRGDFISKELWKNYLSVMVKAGHRLTQILREERKPKMVRFKI